MIVTISGLPGSGKSTVGKLLAKRLGYRFRSVGDLRGEWAVGMGITIDELNKLGEREDWTDRKADEHQKGLGEREDDFVIDGRLSFHFIPRSFKVFLDVKTQEAARRILQDDRPDEPAGTAEGIGKSLERRVRSDDKRYRKLYGIDFRDRRHFDLVIDTTDLTPQQVTDEILKAVKGKQREKASKQ
ncbi:MAG: cytidylate kinase family protein [Candidatus Aenigmarchaeota archaeon]|nr:cytidylate kinase family protein [Candidatus Aenigmarchaeota archaeon]